MKKRSLYTILVALLLVTTGAIIYKYNTSQKEKENQVYALLERKGVSANSEEFRQLKARHTDLLKSVEFDATDTKSALKLAALYIEEARVTGNHMYYDIAALKYVNKVLNIDPNNFNGLVFKSLILLSQHHFADAIVIAEQARTINPANAYVYGLLVDGNVEMGNYDSAIVNADRMNAIRPDLTSYSRVSYLREIFGDYAGAIKAMKMAVETGGRGDEHTEWTRTQLAQLYEKTGDYKSADTLYSLSLSLRPGYAYALAGQARVALAAKDIDKAISLYEQADAAVDDYSMKEELVDLYLLKGDKKHADQLAMAVVDELLKNSDAANNDENIGHYSDRELAYAYLKLKNNDKALEHALLEYNRRPENIDVNETLGWVYYNKGDYNKALPYFKAALKTNSKNPVLLSRASLVFYKTGDTELAKKLYQEVSTSNYWIGASLKTETDDLFKKM